MNLHLDITPTGLALALVVAMLATLIYQVWRADKAIGQAHANTEALIAKLEALVTDLNTSREEMHEACQAFDMSLIGMGEIAAKRHAQSLEIAQATNDGVRVLCEMPKRLHDPTVTARLREEVRAVQQSELAGLTPDMRAHVLHDLAEEMEADRP